ncbi:MFS transporter [Kitasatospora camelliae]|uniref:MFS transporter n=1 Tax=Kitasatospora camelliae TaxID=3156397 RepID=A0AAU8K5I9_9ACTN
MDQYARHRKWLMLALGTGGQTASTTVCYGLPYLIPALRTEYGLGLAQAGLLVSCPILGILLALIGWGVVADRRGERFALAAGLLPAAAVLALATGTRDVRVLAVLLVLTGAAGASVNSASGRLVIGWFPAERRGIAMGVRQASQPLGVGLAAATLSPIAGLGGTAAALGFCAALCGVAGAAVALWAVDPARPTPEEAARTASPYRGGYLWRLHAAAGLLCVPQFVVTGFALVFLIEARGWSAGTAGGVLAAANLAGAGVRLLAGWWSDRVGSRVRPMRVLALATAGDVVLLALGAALDSPLGTGALLLAAGLTVSTNGLHNTAVAERAGPVWAGRALGVHGVGQHLAVVGVPPVAGAVIAAHGYAPAFAAAAVAPVVAAALIPGASRRSGAGRPLQRAAGGTPP